MKIKGIICVLACLCFVALSGCGAEQTQTAAESSKPHTITEQTPSKCEHSMLPADCTKPSTCSKCGYTEGSPLGHTTGFGICDRCGKKQTEDSSIFDSVLDECNKGLQELTNGINNLTTAIGMSTAKYKLEYIYDGFMNFISATVYYELARDFLSVNCDDNEFTEMKKEIQAICDILAPLKEWETVSTSDLTTLLDIEGQLTEHIGALDDIFDQCFAFILDK